MTTQYQKARKERRADLDELDCRRAADEAWKRHMATCREHTCSECFRDGFEAGLKGN